MADVWVWGVLGGINALVLGLTALACRRARLHADNARLWDRCAFRDSVSARKAADRAEAAADRADAAALDQIRLRLAETEPTEDADADVIGFTEYQPDRLAPQPEAWDADYDLGEPIA